jgi:hypothetical protein
MRIKTFLLSIVFGVCLGGAAAQDMDTFYFVSQYRILTDNGEGCNNIYAGHFPMQVYLPNKQEVTLFAKRLGQKRFPEHPIILSNRMLHCLRIIKQRDSLLAVRIVTKDSVRSKNKYRLAVDTTLIIKEMPFNRNVFITCYGGKNPFRNPSMLYISNQFKDLSYMPQHRKRKRNRYLNRFLRGIQYEYNAVTGQLTQLYR